MQKREIVLEYVDTKHQMADIFTKPLAEEQFSIIRREIDMQLCGYVCLCVMNLLCSMRE